MPSVGERRILNRLICLKREDANSEVFDYIQRYYNFKRRDGFNNERSAGAFGPQHKELVTYVSTKPWGFKWNKWLRNFDGHATRSIHSKAAFAVV